MANKTITWGDDDPDADGYIEGDVGPPDAPWGRVNIGSWGDGLGWYAEIEIPNPLGGDILVSVPDHGLKSAEEARAATEQWLASDEAMPEIRATMARQMTEAR